MAGSLIKLYFLLISEMNITAVASKYNVSEYDVIYQELSPHLQTMMRISDEELKIFVYPYPDNIYRPSYNACTLHFQAERDIPKYVLSTHIFTNNSEEADYFLIPHDFSCIFLEAQYNITVLKYLNRILSRRHLTPIIREVVQQYPYFNRSNGADHLFVMTYDHGPYDLFRPNIRFLIDKLQNATMLLNFGSVIGRWMNEKGARNPVDDIVIPQFHDFRPCARWRKFRASQKLNADAKPLDIFFKGDFNNGPLWHGIRNILRPQPNDSQFLFLSGNSSTAVYNVIHNAYFSLCPSGNAPWSVRLYDSIQQNSVPVILANGIILPFEKFINWELFTVKFDSEAIIKGNRTYFLAVLHDKASEHRSWIINKTNSGLDDRETYLSRKIKYVEQANIWLHWKSPSSCQSSSFEQQKNIWNLLKLELWCKSKLRLFSWNKHYPFIRPSIASDTLIKLFCQRSYKTAYKNEYF